MVHSIDEDGGDTSATRRLAEQLGQFTEAEFLSIAGIAAATAETWRKRRQGPAWVRIGRRVYYPRQAVIEFLASRLRTSDRSVADVL